MFAGAFCISFKPDHGGKKKNCKKKEGAPDAGAPSVICLIWLLLLCGTLAAYAEIGKAAPGHG